jgi:hypothetical protein
VQTIDHQPHGVLLGLATAARVSRLILALVRDFDVEQLRRIEQVDSLRGPCVDI